MPRSALPPHLNDPEEIENAFPDDSQYGNGWFGKAYRWFNKKTKTWFAFSYRCTEWWARWRKYPKVLFAIKGKGKWRVEFVDKQDLGNNTHSSEIIFNDTFAYGGYLSRIQPYSKWHFAILWPFIINSHYLKGEVPEYVPGEPYPDLDGRYLNFYWNHFDADLVYWMLTSVYVGTNPK